MIHKMPVDQKPKEPQKWPQRVALVMAIFAFLSFGGAWVLKLINEESNGRKALSPINAQKIWITAQEPFRFEWTGAFDENTSLEVARDPEFHDIVLEEVAARSPFVTDNLPGEGDYYYRLVKRSNNNLYEALAPVRFTVISKTAPQTIYPFVAMVTQEGNPLRFYWQAKHGVTKYRLQIGFDNSFGKVFSDITVNETQLAPQKLPAGDFYWRVRGEVDPIGSTPWSEVRRLTIEKPATLAKAPDVAPKVVAFAPPPPPPAPLPVVPLKVVKDDDKKVKAKKEVRSYGSDPQPLTKLPASMEKKTVVVKEKPKEKPKEKAKVEPKKKATVVAKPSAPVVVPVKPAPEPRKPAAVPKNVLAMPRPKLPPDGVSLVSLSGTQEPILFKWEGVEGASLYRLELAADKDFKNFIHGTVSRENQVMVDKLLPKGQIYWRVRAEKEDSKSDWSQVYSIEK
ncbi:hypothetical protein [Bdellovibrio sp. HCB337]|uniref:hypothetical protein n=1 Tax=Bdellovibrio sp. HCB337 TaxID=3394358 RepID=UPI0039A423F0